MGWTLDSFETNIIGSIFGTLKAVWSLSAAQSSLAVSVWVLGILVGAIGFGYLADRFGRKRLFLATLLWYAAFSVATVFAWNYDSFLLFRALTALAVGGEYSAVTATMGEFIPRRNRGRTDSLILSGFPLGALISAAASYYALSLLPPDIAWRVGFGLGTTMALIFLGGMVLGYCLIQFGVTWSYISAYVVSAEILPTRLRASGLGVSVAFGRVGAMVTPVLLTSAFAPTGTPSAPLLVLLVLATPGPVAAAVWWLKGRETRNVSLEEGSDDALMDGEDALAAVAIQ